MNNNIQSELKNLKINHVFGMAGILFVQPKVSLLTEQDIIKANEIVDEFTTKVNWGIQLEHNKANDFIVKKIEELNEQQVDDYFKSVFKHFGI